MIDYTVSALQELLMFMMVGLVTYLVMAIILILKKILSILIKKRSKNGNKKNSIIKDG